MHKGEKYWGTLFYRMKKEEDNDYCYKKWFSPGALGIFKKDIGFLREGSVLTKKDKTKPFSPSNWEWIKRPIRILTAPTKPRHKYIRQCCTLLFEVDKSTDFNKACVYRVVFSSGAIYIGSTGMIKTRVSCFCSMFNGTSPFHSKRMAETVANSDHATFSVVEYVTNMANIKDLETKEILKNADNPLLINRSLDGNSNKGIRWTPEECQKKKDTLIAKYKSGALKATAYKYRKSMKPPEEMFKSRLFNDKNW